MLHAQLVFKHILEYMFFIGLLGCTTTVLMSWVLVLRDSLSKDDQETVAAAQNRT